MWYSPATGLSAVSMVPSFPVRKGTHVSPASVRSQIPQEITAFTPPLKIDHSLDNVKMSKAS